MIVIEAHKSRTATTTTRTLRLPRANVTLSPAMINNWFVIAATRLSVVHPVNSDKIICEKEMCVSARVSGSNGTRVPQTVCISNISKQALREVVTILQRIREMTTMGDKQLSCCCYC